jgi:hypothetical protein
LEEEESSEEEAEASESKGSRGKGSKGKGGKGEEKKVVTDAFKKQKALMTLMMKSILQQQQHMRDVMGILFLVFVMPTTHPAVAPVKRQGALYAKRVKNKGHGLGPPHLYQYASMVDFFAKKHKEKEQQDQKAKDAVTWLEAHQQEFAAMDLQGRQEVISFFRMVEMYQKESTKLVISWSPTQQGQVARQAWTKILKLEQDWEVKVGRPPANHLERQLGAWLTEFLQS